MGNETKTDGVGIFVAEKWVDSVVRVERHSESCLLYTSPSPRDGLLSRMPSSA